MKGSTGSRKRVSAQTTRRMVVTAMLSAITILLAFTSIGMITLPAPLPSITLVHIPVILAALTEGPVAGLTVGLVFGVSSLINAWETGAISLNLFFRDPLVSVLPRLLIPLTAWGVYALWTRFVKKKGVADKIGIGVASAVGALTNTVFCLGMIALLYTGSKSTGFLDLNLTDMINNLVSAGSTETTYLDHAGAWLVAIVGVPYGLAEAAAAAILVPMVKIAVDAVSRRGKHTKTKPAAAQADEESVAAQAAVDDSVQIVLDHSKTLQAEPAENATES